MDSRRQLKMAALLQGTMGDILIKEGSGIYGSNVIVSIVRVKLSPDLSNAYFYLSIYGAIDPELIVNALNTNTKELRGKLGKALKNNLRRIPELSFFTDDSLEYSHKMNALLKDLNKKNK